MGGPGSALHGTPGRRSAVEGNVHRFELRAVRGNYHISVGQHGVSPQGDAAQVAQRFVRDLRFSVEGNDPGALELAQQIESALDGEPFRLRDTDASLGFRLFTTALVDRIEREVRLGRVGIELRRTPSLTERPQLELPDVPPLPPDRQTSRLSFEVRFVDEVGQAINGLPVELDLDGDVQDMKTNSAGVAAIDDAAATSASASATQVDALTSILGARWDKVRAGKPPKEGNTTTVTFRGVAVGPVPVKAAVSNTVVITPPLGTLFAELFDKSGRVRHANRDFSIDGPQPLSGTTDDDGHLQFEDVFPGDYTLSLTLKFFEGDSDETVETVECPLVVLEAGAEEPQVRRVGAAPFSVLARLRMFFNTNKAFLLPSAIASMQKLRRLYLDNAPCTLLAVGHADARGDSDQNDKLSLDRAKATIAFLKDDVDAWLEFYDASAPADRWGKTEDHLMIVSLPDFDTKPKGEDPVRWFQRTRGLDVDGKAGTQTRPALVTEYMGLDGTSLADFAGEIDARAHGCGENFPLQEPEGGDDGEEGEAANAGSSDDDGAADDSANDGDADASSDSAEKTRPKPADRRVELFFFDPDFGITPEPPSDNSGPGSTEYPLWLARVAKTVELEEGDADAKGVTFVELADAHFRTDSAVVLPEGEAPDDSGEHPALTFVGLIARSLRFNDEHAGRSVLVAGHTDTTGKVDFNQKLSEERAEVALCMLKGSDSRDRFAELCDGRHTVADIKQILSFFARAIGGFDCAPATIDDQPEPEAVKGFQRSFNANKEALESDAEDLDVDGDFGKLTWGAVFECYEFTLRQELGEDADGVKALRDKLVFCDPDHEFLGFSEYFPIEELGVDQYRSQANRRVEILFFEAGEEPDTAHAADDPETSELYLPGHYERTALSAEGSALRNVLVLEWPDSMTEGLPPDLSLIFQIGDGDPAEVSYSDGAVIDGNRRFLFEDYARGAPTTLTARTDSGDTVLWQGQLLDDLTLPPEALATLQDLVTESSVEGPSGSADEMESEVEDIDGTTFLA